MTYAPRSLLVLRAYLAAAAGVELGNLGIVGNAAHVRGYHLGRDRIYSSTGAGDADYSVRTARDRAGLSNAASALDVKFPAATLRDWSTWLVERRCRVGLAADVREVIWTPDGTTVLRWDRQRGVDSPPRSGEADSSHLWHTHLSFYRDAEGRDQVGPLRGYFEGGSIVDIGFKLASAPIGTFALGAGHALISVEDTAHHFAFGTWPGGRTTFPVGAALDLVRQLDGAPVDIEGNSPPLGNRDQVYLVSDPDFGSDVYALRQDGLFTPALSDFGSADTHALDTLAERLRARD